MAVLNFSIGKEYFCGTNRPIIVVPEAAFFLKTDKDILLGFQEKFFEDQQTNYPKFLENIFQKPTDKFC